MYDFPKPLTGDTSKDLRQLWEDVWRIVEVLRITEQSKEDDNGVSKT